MEERSTEWHTEGEEGFTESSVWELRPSGEVHKDDVLLYGIHAICCQCPYLETCLWNSLQYDNSF